MNLSPLARDLVAEISCLPVVDAHEHLPAEAQYLSAGYSGLNMFAGGYIWHDLESAGLSPAFKATMRAGGDRPPASWWPQIRPFWEQVRHTSYSRALRVAVQDLYGLADINDATISEFAEMVRADNRPGLYRRVLAERCHIRCLLTVEDIRDEATFPEDPLLRGMVQLEKSRGSGRQIVEALSSRCNQPIRSLEDAVDAAQSLLRRQLSQGAVALKMYVAHHDAPNASAAACELAEVLRSADRDAPAPALRDYLFEKCLDVAAEADVPVQVHTGYWRDFRELDPKLMFSFALRRRDVRFDMLHLGMPMIQDAILMGKTLPNVTLNMAWCAIVSQEATARALNDMIDQVPVNKIIAFGGDYRVAVQKVYGHLVLAREVVAAVLAQRIDAGDIDRELALRLARLWFHDNPARIYRV
jgi:uncharacterized protein